MNLLAGFDFGSTTSSFLLAEAALERNCVTGRRQFGTPRTLCRPAPVFTPFHGNDIDLDAVENLLQSWLAAAPPATGKIVAGGAIVTGLAARRNNADALRDMIRRSIGEAMVATADDPCLESWLAFMGGCGTLSRYHADKAIINLDIGGGTTNPALGRDGVVLATGCVFIGARHFTFAPGTYRLTGLSDMGSALAAELQIPHGIGDVLPPPCVDALVGWYVAGLEALCRGDNSHFDSPVGGLHRQVAFCPLDVADADITFSGGVGELVYRLAAGQDVPGTTAFGDLGIDLARAIVASSRLSKSLERLIPEHRGRATVTGMTLHGTEISGSSLYLPDDSPLPLTDLPVLAALSPESPDDELERSVALIARSNRGGCLQIIGCPPTAASVKNLAIRLGKAIDVVGLPPGRPLAVLLEGNLGKTLGSYVGDWGRRDISLVVIDEIPIRRAQFVNLGHLHEGMAPVTYYGLLQNGA
ncbi:MAG TPA: ethanolamine ammonia-lyase reactivating factor EutA [Candidatus Sulfotelmatobacter sp.]|jgi:ethanolamine utilization protein EutA|nr:ethanolamine ammonia-lyase reactivating factor EutA [Candidatus Sulfotelmatobacter sp.]